MPQSQCTNLELSQELRELGYPQESLFKYCGGHTSYHDNEDGEWEDCGNTDLLENDEYCHFYGLTCEFTIAAPTVGELDEVLSKYGEYSVVESFGEIRADIQGKGTVYAKPEDGRANVRAKLFIHLLKNNLIEL